MPNNLEAVRAEALFTSPLQGSQHPGELEVRRAVAMSLRRWGTRGCAAVVAGEFGDHPETAVTRMAWALSTVKSVYRGSARRISSPTVVTAPVALAS